MKKFKVQHNGKTYAVVAKDAEHATKIVELAICKDEASSRSTIDALISDEKAAIDAYNVAIKNEDGKLDDKAIAVLRAIRDDEERHVENLYAILSGNVTEKNLEDSIHDYDRRKDFGDVRAVEKYGQMYIGWASLGTVTINAAERFMHDLQAAIDYAKTQR